MKSLDGQVALITGAGGGFGREMIRQFLDQGSRLILADLRLAAIEQAPRYGRRGSV
jgi:NADP-dependent 3-hydroxy acid dehydrogenase YdfG